MQKLLQGDAGCLHVQSIERAWGSGFAPRPELICLPNIVPEGFRGFGFRAGP